MKTHRQNIDTAWELLLETIAEATADMRGQQANDAQPAQTVSDKLDILHAVLRGIGNTAWRDIRDQLRSRQPDATNRPEPSGTLPQSAYLHPLAQVLRKLGGEARASVAIAAVGEHLASSLQEADREPVESGQVRWIVNTRFARNELKELGLIARNTPNGTWKLTEAGMRWAEAQNARRPRQPVPEPDNRQPELF